MELHVVHGADWISDTVANAGSVAVSYRGDVYVIREQELLYRIEGFGSEQQHRASLIWVNTNGLFGLLVHNDKLYAISRQADGRSIVVNVQL